MKTEMYILPCTRASPKYKRRKVTQNKIIKFRFL